MGLFGLIKKQFIDVIDWTESSDGILSFQYPMEDREIQNGAILTVRESQLVLFVNEGQIADLFEPGKHTLTTQTLPVMTSLKNWDKLFKSPFKSDIFFYSTREQIDQRWGTQQPITIRDKELGPIRLRAHGSYSYKIKNPKTFFKKISGTREAYTTAELDGQIRAGIITQIATVFGAGAVAFLDMAANQSKFSESLKAAVSPLFADYGLELCSFFVQSLSLPEEVQAYLDKSAQMNLVGDLKKYTSFQAADSIPAAAAGSGGAMGTGLGLSAGMAIGQQIADSMGGGNANHGSTSSEDAITTLNRLHDLVQKGVLTAAEFELKKAELLKKIT